MFCFIGWHNWKVYSSVETYRVARICPQCRKVDTMDALGNWVKNTEMKTAQEIFLWLGDNKKKTKPKLTVVK